MDKWTATDIGNPVVWFATFLAVIIAVVGVAYIFFSVVGTLISFATHCRGC